MAAKVTLDDQIKALEEKQAAAREAAKKATADLAKARRKAKEIAEKEAAKKEQAEALEFYRKYGKYTADELELWLALIEEAKMQTITVNDKDGNPVSRVVYDWLKSCYTKRLKANFTGGSQ